MAVVQRRLFSDSLALMRVSVLRTRGLHVNYRHRATVTARLSSADHSGSAAAGVSTDRRLDLSGVYPPITTPFDNKENVDYNKLEFNMQRWNDILFKGDFALSLSLSLSPSVSRSFCVCALSRFLSSLVTVSKTH